MTDQVNFGDELVSPEEKTRRVGEVFSSVARRYDIMNVRMWLHAATQRNIAQLKTDGINVLDPDEGEMACGEFGPGRLPEPQDILERISAFLQ